ncbi:recombinase family protein [Leuconostoc suionicum]|uniref:recombinase family protein n=1 Tax=Leuconostoc suionicum TaxID=1511761 RepID=UPI00233F4B1B|nr:recombinase family protein [Leuconostoc suionicum]MDC2815392.1 recombinase family protein [Leuconostoc suionicum]
MIYGYARVSTESQHLEAQVAQLNQAGVDKIYQEKFTGTTTERPIFETLLKKLSAQDTITVTKLDRFARNTKEALELMQILFDRNIAINILNLGRIDESPTGKLIFTIFSAFAQFERDLIVTRTQEGKAYARVHNKNFHEGRPFKYSDTDILDALFLYDSGKTYNQITQQTGISIATLKRRFKLIKLKIPNDS